METDQRVDINLYELYVEFINVGSRTDRGVFLKMLRCNTVQVIYNLYFSYIGIIKLLKHFY